MVETRNLFVMKLQLLVVIGVGESGLLYVSLFLRGKKKFQADLESTHPDAYNTLLYAHAPTGAIMP